MKTNETSETPFCTHKKEKATRNTDNQKRKKTSSSHNKEATEKSLQRVKSDKTPCFSTHKEEKVTQSG